MRNDDRGAMVSELKPLETSNGGLLVLGVCLTMPERGRIVAISRVAYQQSPGTHKKDGVRSSGRNRWQRSADSALESRITLFGCSQRLSGPTTTRRRSPDAVVAGRCVLRRALSMSHAQILEIRKTANMAEVEREGGVWEDGAFLFTDGSRGSFSCDESIATARESCVLTPSS